MKRIIVLWCAICILIGSITGCIDRESRQNITDVSQTDISEPNVLPDPDWPDEYDLDNILEVFLSRPIHIESEYYDCSYDSAAGDVVGEEIRLIFDDISQWKIYDDELSEQFKSEYINTEENIMRFICDDRNVSIDVLSEWKWVCISWFGEQHWYQTPDDIGAYIYRIAYSANKGETLRLREPEISYESAKTNLGTQITIELQYNMLRFASGSVNTYTDALGDIWYVLDNEEYTQWICSYDAKFYPGLCFRVTGVIISPEEAERVFNYDYPVINYDYPIIKANMIEMIGEPLVDYSFW